MFQVKSTVSVMNHFWANLLSVSEIQVIWDVAPCCWDGEQRCPAFQNVTVQSQHHIADNLNL